MMEWINQKSKLYKVSLFSTSLIVILIVLFNKWIDENYNDLSKLILVFSYLWLGIIVPQLDIKNNEVSHKKNH